MENRIKNLIEKYEYISFDVFGTLVQRDVNEVDIFTIISREYKLDNFVEERMAAEKKAAEKNPYYSIDDIYAEFSNKYIDDLISIENIMQLEIVQPSKIGKKVFEYAVKHNKKILIISDMYLKKDIIIKLLYKCGYSNICENFIFVSCEEKASKRDGSIYDKVINLLGIKKEKILHIGDAWRSDFINPRRFGIRSVHFAENVYKGQYNGMYKYKNNKQNKMLNRFIYNHESTNKDNGLFGYECIGPLLYGFIKWLQKNSIEKYDSILFLAREGKIFLDAYQCIEKNDKQQYLLVSRKSLVQTLLWKRTLIEKIEMLPLPEYFTLNTLFDYLGVEEPENLRKEFDGKIQKSDLKKQKAIWRELEAKEELINQFSKEQYQLFIELLPKDIDNVAIVDIGWKGTMQHYLTEIFKDINLTNVHGFYLGVSGEGLKDFSKEEKSGYLFEGDTKCDERYLENKIFSFSGLLEATLTARHGSVHSYYYKGNCVRTKLYTQNDRDYMINDIQKGAIQFVKDAVGSVAMKDVELSPIVAADKLVRIGNYPRKQELEYASNISFFDTENNKLIEKLTLREIKSGLKIYFNNSKWKIGFIKMNFPFIPFLPQIYAFFRKIRK